MELTLFDILQPHTDGTCIFSAMYPTRRVNLLVLVSASPTSTRKLINLSEILLSYAHTCQNCGWSRAAIHWFPVMILRFFDSCEDPSHAAEFGCLDSKWCVGLSQNGIYAYPKSSKIHGLQYLSLIFPLF